MSGNRPAHMTAKIVMPSANLLIDVRQPCFSSSRIAEMSVPAWPMPIHQTKLMIAKPQPTGMLTPQMPVPLSSSHVTAIPSIPMIMKPMETTMNQLRGCLVVRTTPPILSVIEPNVWPGSMSGAGSYVAGLGLIIVHPRGFAPRTPPHAHSLAAAPARAIRVARSLPLAGAPERRPPFAFAEECSSSDQLRIRVAQRRQVRRPRPRVEAFEQTVVALERLELRHARVRVVQVAEDDGVGRAGRGAGGYDLAVADLPILALGVDARVVDPLHAVRALLHDAAAPDGDVGVAQRLEVRRVPVLEE